MMIVGYDLKPFFKSVRRETKRWFHRGRHRKPNLFIGIVASITIVVMVMVILVVSFVLVFLT